MTVEQWKPVVGFEGHYEVSDTGRVRSIPRVVRTATRLRQTIRGRLLRPTPARSGHLSVDLRNNERRKMSRVHRLVLEAFVGPAPAGTEGCHRDGDPTNNALENLRWGTRSDNEGDKKRHGTDNAGERHGLARLCEEDVRRIREARLFGATQPSLARAYGTSQSRISFIVSRKAWRHVV